MPSSDKSEGSSSVFMKKQKRNIKKCIKCGKCEKICPQHLPIREHLVEVAKTFEK